ncbi:MAG: DUF1667 domain-containing protein [Bacilli bacterium]|nr:DUF1667 domain-containing protein [Bacilli bacterium]
MEHILTCIVCPRGCELHVDENFNVTGNSCPRGAIYGAQEIRDPRRTLTTTVKCRGKLLRVCPCKTSGTIRKGDQFRIMEIVNQTEVQPPVKMGQLLVSNIGDTGVDLIATREINE